jgi:hypothetical protein
MGNLLNSHACTQGLAWRISFLSLFLSFSFNASHTKVPGLVVPTMQSYKDLLCRVVDHPRRPASSVKSTFLRDGNCLVGLV